MAMARYLVGFVILSQMKINANHCSHETALVSTGKDGGGLVVSRQVEQSVVWKAKLLRPLATNSVDQ